MNTPNATDKAMQEQEEQVNIERLVTAQQDFIKRWKPDKVGFEDRYAQDQFEHDLFYLIHLIYNEAQRPLFKAMQNMGAATFTWPPMFAPETKDKP